MGVKGQFGSQQYSTNISMVTVFLNTCNHWGVEAHKQQDTNEFGSYLYPIQELPARVNKKVAEELVFHLLDEGDYHIFTEHRIYHHFP